MFAVAQCQLLKLWAANHGAWRRHLDIRVLQVFSPASCMLRLRFCNDPPHDAGKEIIRDLPTIREVDFLKLLSIIRHFQNRIGSDIPNTLHFPTADILSTLLRQSREGFICDVETIVDIDNARALSDEWAYIVNESAVGDIAVVD